MTMTATELQAYVDAGLVPSTSGTSEISTTITLDGSRKVVFEPNSFTWTGASTNSLFLFDKSVANPYPLIFNGVDVTSAIDGSSIFKINASEDTPHNCTFVNCDWTSLGAYAWDLNNVNYLVLPTWKNIITRGSGAVRLRASGGADYWHGTSQMTIRGWTHIGSDRWGPAFNFRGCSGLIMENVSDTGSLALHSDLFAAGWTGPLSILHQAVRTPNTYTNFHVDYDEANDDDAPNCYIGEIRTDLSTGTGQHEMCTLINPTLRHTAIDASVKPWRFMGSDAAAAHVLVVRLVDCDSPSTDDILAGGRCAIFVERPHYKNGESTKLSGLETLCDSVFPKATSFQDPIVIEDGKLPAAAFSSGVTYSGSQSETDYASEVLQPEELLEA